MSAGRIETLRAAGHPIGEVLVGRAELAARIRVLGRLLASEYEGREPLLIAPLRSSLVFLADLSRALSLDHGLDTISVSSYDGGPGGGAQLTKDVSTRVTGRDVIVVEGVVDTGLTLAFVLRALREREPASLAAVALLDRPYRRLVDDLPLAHVGFTLPDELVAGYGLGLDEKWRTLPDIHRVMSEALPAALAAA